MNGKVEFGTIEYINEDNSPINAQKEQFLRYLNLYRNAGNFIAVALNSLDKLTIKETKLSKFAPAFTNCVHYSFWSTSIILLNCFYSRADDLSIYSFIEFIRNNYKSIFTGKFFEIYKHKDGSVKKQIKFNSKDIFSRIEQSNKLINDNKTLIDKLDTFRNEMFAHFSKDKQNKLNNQHLNIDELKKLLIITEKIVNLLRVPYDRSYECFEPANSTDIIGIENILELYEENREVIKNEHIKKLTEEFFKQVKKKTD